MTKLCENVSGGEVISITAEGHVDVAGNNSGSIKWTISKPQAEQKTEPPAPPVEPVVTTDEAKAQNENAEPPAPPVE